MQGVHTVNAPVSNAVHVAATRGRKTRVKVERYLGYRVHLNRPLQNTGQVFRKAEAFLRIVKTTPQSTLQATGQRRGRVVIPSTSFQTIPICLGQIAVYCLRLRMYSGVGSTGNHHTVRATQNKLQRALEHTLYSNQVWLSRPAAEERTVVGTINAHAMCSHQGPFDGTIFGYAL